VKTNPKRGIWKAERQTGEELLAMVEACDRDGREEERPSAST